MWLTNQFYETSPILHVYDFFFFLSKFQVKHTLKFYSIESNGTEITLHNNNTFPNNQRRFLVIWSVEFELLVNLF